MKPKYILNISVIFVIPYFFIFFLNNNTQCKGIAINEFIEVNKSAIHNSLNNYSHSTLNDFIDNDSISFESLFDTIINEPINFSRIHFSSGFYFDSIFLKKTFNLIDCQIDNKLDIVHVDFEDTVNINGCIIDSIAVFQMVFFNQETNFNDDVFNNDFIFQDNQIKNGIYFRNVIFNSNAIFDGTSFGRSVEFQDCHFKKGVSFFAVTLPYFLNLGFTKISDGEIDLSTVGVHKEGAKCIINLVYTDISKISLQYKYFELFFPQGQNGLTFDQKSNLYETLLRRFQTLGYTESYQELDIEYKHFKEYENGNITSKIFYRIKQGWWNFGYHKEYIIYWILGFMLLFTIINAIFIHPLNDKVYTVFRNSEHKLLKRLRIITRFKFAFYYTIFIFFGLKLNHKEIKSFGGGFFYVLCVYSIGLVCLAYFANFVISKF